MSVITQSDISEQIKRILRSECFRGKIQMQSLLRLLGHHWETQTTLKPDRITAELWPENSPQRSSPVLATAIARLRRTLDAYYASEGATDPIIICLPDRSQRSNANVKDTRWILAKPRELPESAGLPKVAEPLEAEPKHSAPDQTEAPAATRPWSRYLLLTAFLIAAAVGIVIRWTAPWQSEPAAAQLSGNTLQVVDTKGALLWSSSFSDGFWPEFYKDGIATRVWVEDLGDGHKSVLLLYHSANNPQGHSSVLICYSHRGEELWRWTPGRVLPELGNEPAVFIARTLTFIKATNGARQIVVLSGHFPQYPAQIALLDAHGKTVSEYWHSGHLEQMVTADLDGNGRQEIIATGTANGYKRGVLVVLDPDKISGASVETGETRFQLHGLGVAHERFRLLFPRSDLNIATTTYNFAEGVTVANGTIRVSVRECELNPYCLIWYGFDSKFNLRTIYLDDHFKDAHEAYFLHAVPLHSLKDEMAQFEKVRCLTGCASDFVPNRIEDLLHS